MANTPPNEEKQAETEHISGEEHTAGLAGDSVEVNPLPALGSPERIKAERDLVRKLDKRILPTLFVIFIMNYIDVRPRLIAYFLFGFSYIHRRETA